MTAFAYDGSKGERYLSLEMEAAGVEWIWNASLSQRETKDAAQASIVIAGFTLDMAKANARRMIREHAAELRNTAMAEYSAYEVGAWPLKVGQAKAFVDWDDAGQLGRKPDSGLLIGEATVAAVTERAVADRIILNSGLAEAFESTVAGVATKHKNAIEPLTTFAAVDAYDWSVGWPPASLTLFDMG